MTLADQLIALGGAFLAAALIAKFGRRIGLPTIPLFIFAGIMFGPNTPGVVLFENPADLKLLATLGLIFLLFYLGLEFRVDQIIEGGGKLVLSGVAYIVLNVGGGFIFGMLLGWGMKEAIVLAGALGISSSAITTKIVVETKRLKNPETKLILGITVFEDLFLALYLAVVTPLVSGATETGEIIRDVVVGFAFLFVLACVARWGAAGVGKLINSPDDELLIIGFIGLVVFMSGVAEELGVSDAIGAFMVGLILAETRARRRIEKFVKPLRDAFGALFFFYFGLQLVPESLIDIAGLIALAVLMTMVTVWCAGTVAARIHEMGPPQAANVALTVFARGEFALILVTLAANANLDERMASLIGGYVLVLAVIGPLMASRSQLFVPAFPKRFFPAAGRQSEITA